MIKKRMVLTVIALMLTLLLASAAANIIVAKYAVDRTTVKQGDNFRLTIFFQRVGSNALGANLSLINTAPADFALADGSSLVKITNPADSFSVDMTLQCLGTNNVFSFDIIDEATGETIASDKIVINEVKAPSNDDDVPTPPVDSSQFKPHFELANQPFSEEFVNTKNYSLIIKLKNTSAFVAKDVNLTIEKGDDDLPFDLTRSQLISNLAQIAYKKTGQFKLDFAVDPTAASKWYKLNLKIDYKNSHGDQFSQVLPIVFKVSNSNVLPFVNLVDTAVTDNGETQNIKLTLANGGTLVAKDVQVILSGFSADGLALAGDFATKTVGDIAGGQRVVVDFDVKKMSAAAGVQTLTATTSYGDARGEKFQDVSQVFVDTGFAGLAKTLDVSFEREQYYLTAGGTIDVVVHLTNRAERALDNLKLNVKADGLQMMSTFIKQIETIKAGETLSYHFKVAADQGAAKNTYPVRAEISTAGQDGATLSAVAGITIDDKAAGDFGKPKVIIDNYDYGDDYIMAGEVFPLTIGFKNTSNTTGIRNVKASYLSDDNVFIPVDSSNAIFIEEIGSGQVVTKTVMVKTKNDAAPRTYVLDFTIAYEDERGNAYDAKDNPYEEKERISINLKQKNRLEIPQIDLPEMIMVGEPVNIDVNFFNMGKSTMYNLLVSTEGNFEMRDATSYVGTFEPGKSEYYSATIIPQEAGELKGTISFSFEDSNGEKEVIEKELTLNVMEGGFGEGDGMWEENGKYPGGFPDDGFIDEEGELPGESDGVFGYLKIAAMVLLPLIIIAVIVILVRRRNKKHKAALLEIDDEDN